MKMRFAALTAILALGLAGTALAQNPRGAATADVGGQKVEIDYGRPALKGRNIDELMKNLPPDGIWRAGENQVSTLTTAGDIMVGDTKVPAGKYTVYVHAEKEGGWSFILNKDQGVPLGKIWAEAPDDMKNEPWPHGMDYTDAIKDQEVVRAKMKPVKDAPAADMFTMDLAPKGDGAILSLSWGDQAWMVPVKSAQ